MLLWMLRAQNILPLIFLFMYVMQELRQKGVQKAEGTSQLQDWNMEHKDLESRREIGEPEKGNAEE